MGTEEEKLNKKIQNLIVGNSKMAKMQKNEKKMDTDFQMIRTNGKIKRK